MLETLITVLLSCGVLIAVVLIKPNITIKGKQFSIYWLAPLIGAIVIICLGLLSPKEVLSGLTASGEVNPIKILVLFISMTIISVFLDNAGFFRYLAGRVLAKSKSGQRGLFNALYLMVSVLTVFTSNDIIILTFTPFICYFTLSADLDPIPYLIAEFIAANTWSMALIIGNPTNIYLASSAGIDFFLYISKMLLPTVLAGVVSFCLLRLIFRKQLAKPIAHTTSNARFEDKGAVIIGLVHLIGCIVFLSIASYLSLPMWKISLGFCISLIIVSSIYLLFSGNGFHLLRDTVKRAPFDIIPFVLAMFVLVLALDKYGTTASLSVLLDTGNNMNALTFGISSFLTANIINNIPMSVLFSSIIGYLPDGGRSAALYASIIGSNLGAFFTPLGALAGIMWMDLLKHHHVKLTFLQFIKYGALISLAALGAALIGLAIVL